MNHNTKVVILCGGIGTRLKEETELKPKPMVEIGGKPILWHIMKIYAYYGFCNFIICLGYKGEVIKDYFFNYEVINNDFAIELGNNNHVEIFNKHKERGWRITLVNTGDRSLKGSRIKKIETHIDDKLFMLTYGDGVANINLQELLSFHKSHGHIGTITGVHPPSRFGEIVTKGKRVVSFNEKPQVSEGLINGGFFVFNSKIFEYLLEDDNCDFEVGPLEQLAKEGELMVYELNEEWACMDTRRDMDHLNMLWENGKAFWKIWDE